MTLQRKQAILREAREYRDMARFARMCAKGTIERMKDGEQREDEDPDEFSFLTRTTTYLMDQREKLTERARESE